MGENEMKKSMLLIGTSFIAIIAAITSLVINTQKDGESKMNELSMEMSEDKEDAVDSMKIDETAIETIEEDEYTILLKGSARPQNGEIVVEDAARIGVEEINKEYDVYAKNYTVEMIFLDGIGTKTGTWSGHIVLSDNEKYEFVLNGKDGNIEFMKKND